MKEDIIRGVLIDPYAELSVRAQEDITVALDTRLRVQAIENNLKEMYKLLHCQCIDITERSIGGQRYSIVLDDEGLLIDKPIKSAVASDGIPMLAGALFICKSVYDADEMSTVLASIDDDDYENIMQHVKIAVDTRKSIDELKGGDCYPVLVLDGNGYC